MKQSLIADLGDYLPYVTEPEKVEGLKAALDAWALDKEGSFTSRSYHRKYLYTDFLWGLIYAHKFMGLDIFVLVEVREFVSKYFGAYSGVLKIGPFRVGLPFLRVEDESMYIEIDRYISRYSSAIEPFAAFRRLREIQQGEGELVLKNTYSFFGRFLPEKINFLSKHHRLYQLHKDNSNLFWGLCSLGEFRLANELLSEYIARFGYFTFYLDESNKSMDLTIFCLVEMFVELDRIIEAEHLVDFVMNKFGHKIPSFIIEQVGAAKRLDLAADDLWLDSSVDWIVAVFKLAQRNKDRRLKLYLEEMIVELEVFQDGQEWFKVYRPSSNDRVDPAKAKGVTLLKKAFLVRSQLQSFGTEICPHVKFALEDR